MRCLMTTAKIGKFYTDLNIKFTIENTELSVLKISFERFLRSIPNHSHSSNSYEIHYIAYGYGSAMINNAAYEIAPNTLYVTGPHVDHSQTPINDDPMAEYCIYLKLENKAIMQNKKNPSSLMQSFEGMPFWFGQDSQNIHSTMQNIFIELENQQTGYITQVQTLLQQLIVSMVRNYEGEKASSVHFETSNILDRNYLIIEECFLYEYCDITLENLAKRLGLSTRQTERLLIQHYGKTFLEKKCEAKMSAAAILLKDPLNRITNIANTLGYSSCEHFSNAFRRYYKTSASEYRKSNKFQESLSLI